MSAQIGTVVGYEADVDDEGPETDVNLGGQSDSGEGDPEGVDHFGPAGDDSPPLPEDSAVVVELDDDGEQSAAVGYADGVPRTAAPGAKRFYSRDANSGEVTAEVNMRNDGSIELTQTDGAAVTLDSTGAITLTTAGAEISVSAEGAIKLSGASVTLDSGTPLAIFLETLQTAMGSAWTPAPNDGGAALKASLAAWLALPSPADK